MGEEKNEPLNEGSTEVVIRLRRLLVQLWWRDGVGWCGVMWCSGVVWCDGVWYGVMWCGGVT